MWVNNIKIHIKDIGCEDGEVNGTDSRSCPLAIVNPRLLIPESVI
jgi:hypothetical protein